MTTIEIIEAILIIAIGIVILAYILPLVFAVLLILWELFSKLYMKYLFWMSGIYEKIHWKIKGH